jgi:hypothetical protein
MPIYVTHAAPFSVGDARSMTGAQNATKGFAKQTHAEKPFIANIVTNRFVLIVINRVESTVPIAEYPLARNVKWYITANEVAIHCIVTGADLDSIVECVKLNTGAFVH